MTEPKRLLEDPPNSLAATLIDVTLDDGPGSARALERTAAALGVSALVGTAVAATTSTATAAMAATSATTHVVAASAGSAAASGAAVSATAGAAVSATAGAATKLGAGIVVKWLAIGSLSTATVVGGAALVVDARSEKPAAASLAATSNVASLSPNSVITGATPARATPSHAALTASDADQPATDMRLQEKANASTREALRAEAMRARANTGATLARAAALASPPMTAAPENPTHVPSAAFPKVETAPSIADEIALLDRARSELANRNPRATLATLDRLERGGSATLSPEASVVRIEALLQLGDKARAATLARRFLATYPDSAHTPRLEEIIAP